MLSLLGCILLVSVPRATLDPVPSVNRLSPPRTELGATVISTIWN
jgi:hypothetical protein